MSNLSGFAIDADSEYVVVKRETGEILTNCFVLKPEAEHNAYKALLYFFIHLEESSHSKRMKKLHDWLQFLATTWEEREKRGEIK